MVNLTIIPTTVHGLTKYINAVRKLYFPTVKPLTGYWLPGGRCLGLCHLDGSNRIGIIIKYNDAKQFLATVIHEITHNELYIKGITGHGKQFKARCNEVYRLAGLPEIAAACNKQVLALDRKITRVKPVKLNRYVATQRKANAR